jgi:hypothetical protein
VTHVPTGHSVERARGDRLQSPVQAQTECLEELRLVVASGDPSPRGVEETPAPDRRPVSRDEFEALAARVAALERAVRSAVEREM